MLTHLLQRLCLIKSVPDCSHQLVLAFSHMFSQIAAGLIAVCIAAAFWQDQECIKVV